MYSFLHDILSDKKGGEIFTCFGVWHFVYIALAAALFILLFLIFRKKDRARKEKAATALIDTAFGLYIADLFLMPFAYEQIDIEKLPFHICTAMCVMCFLSRHIAPLKKLRVHFALLGFISNLVYLIYPAGVMWHAVHPLCYRVAQTLLFHGVMTVYGLLTLLFEKEELHIRRCPRDLAVLAGMTLWALLGNALYTGAAGSYDHFFNWFFVLRDPFGVLDAKIAPFVMPFLNITVFFTVEILIYCLFLAAGRINLHRQQKKETEHEHPERQE